MDIGDVQRRATSSSAPANVDELLRTNRAAGMVSRL